MPPDDEGHSTMKMDVVFFNAIDTPLWSSSLVPRNVGQYVGLCIFLVAFATVFRLLVALRMNFYQLLGNSTHKGSQDHLLEAHSTLDTGANGDSIAKKRKWKAKDAAIIGVVDVIIAGVSYLL